MADDIPMWAKERACELANSHHLQALKYRTFDVGRDGFGAITALSLHIMAHEQEPVDPIINVLIRLLAARKYMWPEKYAKEIVADLRAEGVVLEIGSAKP